ncbi:cysteine hydrolase family protein [Streptomyces sp. NPDC050095]|uniref:cysteine hydrolase family protein n=1 Tax=unclassified Streptomyces TaxID=2593676 RepID=UPI00342B3E52
MTTLPDRPRTALLVIDVQNGVMEPSHDSGRVISNVAALVEQARTQDVPVLWVQHSDDDGLKYGSQAWEYVPELAGRRESEPTVHKTYPDSFEDTDLEEHLAERGIGHLVVAGAQTDCCIRATLHGAQVRGYDVTLVGDAHTTEDLTAYGAPAPAQVIAHTNLYWEGQRAPGRTAAVVDTAEVSFPTDDVPGAI